MGKGAPRGPTTRTVLFTDVVSSTARRARIGDTAADVLERQHDELLRSVVARHSGTVVKSTGDGIMAVFESAAQGAACAVAIQQALERRSRRGGEVMDVRIGLSVGDVGWERDDYFGIPVNEAARLEGAAEAGQILASELVRLLAGSRSDVRFRPIGSLDLKGLAEPVRACEVEWDPQTPDDTPPPAGLLHAAGAPFVGREAELTRLGELWKQASSGDRRVAFVAGEPGIGKTRLAAELAHDARADLATVLYGAADEDVPAPFRPIIEALSPIVHRNPLTELARWTGNRFGELSRLFPGLADFGVPTKADPETERLLLFEAVELLVSGASLDGGLLLVLDDLHWADPSTVALVRHLTRSLGPAALLIVGTYRDSEIHQGHPLANLLADLRRDASVERLRLVGLQSAETAELITAAVGRVPDEGLVERLQADTEGNPFFVQQLLAHLSDGRSNAIIPEGVREVVGRRLARLTERTRHVLGVASVIGREFDFGLVADVHAADDEELVDALDEAVASGLVNDAEQSSARYAFSHALVQAAVADTLTTARRQRLHREVGMALEQRYAHSHDGALLPALVRHFGEAVPLGEADRAVRYAIDAGRLAIDRLAYDEAVVRLERALAVLDEGGIENHVLRSELLLVLTEARRGCGDTAGFRQAAASAAEEARMSGSVELLARAAVLALPWTLWAQEARDSAALCEEALALLGDRHPNLRAQLLATLADARVALGDSVSARELAHQALDLARRLDDDETLGLVLIHAMNAAVGDERLALADEEIAVGHRTGRMNLVLGGLLSRAAARLELTDVDGFVDDTDEAQRLGAKWHWWALGRLTETHCALLALLRGRFDEVEPHAKAALDHAGSDPNTFSAYASQMFLLAREQGRLADMKPLVVAAAHDNPGVVAYRAAAALVYVELGEVTEALKEFRLLASGGFASVPRDVTWTDSMAMLTEVCSTVGSRRDAATLLHLLRPHAGRLAAATGSVCHGAVDRFLGMLAAALGRWEESQEHFGAALAVEERIGARPLAARTRYWYARMLLARNAEGDRNRAADLLHGAADTADELGMQKLVADCRALI
jgi:class 3 adenylate cyclase/tetratricopeptide (TPR) repeat protein